MKRSYFAPTTVPQVIELLSKDGDAGVVAGGTDLVVRARSGQFPMPSTLIAIHGVAELARQHFHRTGIQLEALTTHAWLEQAPVVAEHWAALADAAGVVGSPATRSTGTLGGNIMNASPAMDTGAPLLVLDATVRLASARGTRTCTVAELLAGPRQTTARRDELLTAIDLPTPPARSGSAYIRLQHREAMEIAIVGAAALVALDDVGRISKARIALTAATPTCVRVPAAEAALLGHHPEGPAVREASRLAAEVVRPIDDVRASARYRLAMIQVVVGRALAVAASRAAGAHIAVPANRYAPATLVGSSR